MGIASISPERPVVIHAYVSREVPREYVETRANVVDLLKDPGLARAHQIVAIPTLVRGIPQPLRKIIGDLSATERVLVGLDVRRHDG